MKLKKSIISVKHKNLLRFLEDCCVCFSFVFFLINSGSGMRLSFHMVVRIENIG